MIEPIQPVYYTAHHETCHYKHREMVAKINEIITAFNGFYTDSKDSNYSVALEACRHIKKFRDDCFCGYPLEIKGKPVDHTALNEAARLAEISLQNAFISFSRGQHVSGDN